MLSFKLLPHTADVIIYAEASSLEELFKAALFGLVSVLKPEDAILKNNDFHYDISLEASNKNLLLVDFLSESLTAMHIKKGLISSLAFEKLNENQIECRLFLQSVDFFERDVKAISYHNVDIKFNNTNTFEAEIIIDI